MHDIKPIKPHLQLAMNELIHSQSWLTTCTIAAGVNYKTIKIFDTREPNPVLSIQSKAVYSITQDPFYSQLASCGEDGIIKLWDLRATTKNILSINSEAKTTLPIMEWSPTKPGLLATVSKDAMTIKFWDISRISNDDKGEVKHGLPFEQSLDTSVVDNIHSLDVKTDIATSFAVLKHFRTSKLSDDTIAGFSWLPKNLSNSPDPKFLAFTKNNYAMLSCLTAIPVFSISPKEDYALYSLNSIYSGALEGNNEYSFIAPRMFNRANAGYSTNVNRNIEILSSEYPRNEELLSIWSLVDGTSKLNSFEGLLSILENMNLDREKVKTVDPGTGFFLTTYTNPSRSQCLSLCLEDNNLFDVEEELLEQTISEYR